MSQNHMKDGTMMGSNKIWNDEAVLNNHLNQNTINSAWKNIHYI